jgi:hypothetical protein
MEKNRNLLVDLKPEFANALSTCITFSCKINLWYNFQKRKEEELSRSSSFDKSNKSVSVNNSHV